MFWRKCPDTWSNDLRKCTCKHADMDCCNYNCNFPYSCEYKNGFSFDASRPKFIPSIPYIRPIHSKSTVKSYETPGTVLFFDILNIDLENTIHTCTLFLQKLIKKRFGTKKPIGVHIMVIIF